MWTDFISIIVHAKLTIAGVAYICLLAAHGDTFEALELPDRLFNAARAAPGRYAGKDQRAAIGRVVEAVDPLIDGINKAEAKANSFAFSGRSGLQPLWASAVRHHVRSYAGAR